jgi:uncharacterized protein
MLSFSRSTVIAFLSSSTPSSRLYSSTTALMSLPKKTFVLRYDYIPEVLEKRGPFREGHLALAKEMIEAGDCISGGPTAIADGTEDEKTPTGALFLFKTEEAAKLYVSKDPYVSGGIVTKHQIEEWSVLLQ